MKSMVCPEHKNTMKDLRYKVNRVAVIPQSPNFVEFLLNNVENAVQADTVL